MQIEPRTSTHRPRPAIAWLAILLALLLAAALSAAASARSSHGHRASCTTTRHARRAVRHCSRHHAHKVAHKPKKQAKPAAPAPKLTPASCEDGSAPVRSADGSYTCQDGSEPACEDGSEPIRPATSSAPLCRVPREEAECTLEAGGDCGIELACEDAEEVAGPQGCEHGSAFEEESELEP